MVGTFISNTLRAALLLGLGVVMQPSAALASCGQPGQAPGWISTDYYACGWPLKLLVCWQRNYACCPNAVDIGGQCQAVPVCDASCQATKITNVLGPVDPNWLSPFGASNPNHGPLYGEKVSRADLGNVDQIKIDVAGEGQHQCQEPGGGIVTVGHSDTVNLNGWNKITCNGPDFGKDVSNFVAGNADQMPFEDGFADVLYIENGPTTQSVAQEFARVLRNDGTVNIIGASEQSTEDFANQVKSLTNGQITAEIKNPSYWSFTVVAGVYNHDEL